MLLVLVSMLQCLGRSGRHGALVESGASPSLSPQMLDMLLAQPS